MIREQRIEIRITKRQTQIMLKLFLWLRYLRKKKIVLLSIAAVALSVALMMTVDSLFIGYIKGLEKNFAAESGDVILSSYSIPEYEVFLDELHKLDEVEAASAVSFSGGLLWLESGDVREVMIHGIEPQRDSSFTDWKGSLLRQKTLAGQVNFEVPDFPDEDGCWLGIGIVAEPDEKTDEYDLEQVEGLIGKKVILTTFGYSLSEQDTEESTAKYNEGRRPKRRVVPLRICDIAFTQTYFGDRTLYLPFDKLHKIKFGSDRVENIQRIKIKLKERTDPELAKNRIRQQWAKFAADHFERDGKTAPAIWLMTVKENFDFLGELHKQLGILLLIFGVICSVAVLLIFCIFYMIVETKRKDIAIIKSCGATSSSAAFIFLGFGACVGIAGSGLGIIFGYIITKNINVLENWVRIIFGLKLWRVSSYILKAIPNTVNWPGVWPIVLVSVLGCVIGALIPAIVAARTKPVEILRYE